METYTTTLKKIGNSKGITIPAKVIKKHKLTDNSKIIVREHENGIDIRFQNDFFADFKKLSALPGEDWDVNEIRHNRINKEHFPEW